ncbi:MAG: metallophosphoesterase, partial [Opitutaceae bacterium]|nr:metallophosphoesterase [Opitutaceae bacterium]
MIKKQITVLLLILAALLARASAAGKAAPEYQPPELSDPQSWSMILIPDPQSYVKSARNQPLFEHMTAWIADNTEKLNIKMVLCTGDLVEHNEMLNPPGLLKPVNKRADQPSKRQWESVARAFGRLDGVVPYVTATGNHDYGYGYGSSQNRHTNFPKYFPVDKNQLNLKHIREVGLSAAGIPTLENAAYEFTLPDGRGLLVLSLEFDPRDSAVEWAKTVVNNKKYENHTVFLLTHSYLNSRSEHITKENYELTDANYGAGLFAKLVQPSRNIQMVFSGHIAAPNNVLAHLGFRTDKNAAGKSVHQMTFNAQALGGGWHGNGGDGWLRILEFLPDGKTVKVKTFSPLFAISPTTQQFAWRTKPYDE